MSRKDHYLTKISKEIIDGIYENSDLTIKEIMSASVLAFNDLTEEKKHEYVIRAKMGRYGRESHVKYVLLTETEQRALNEFRRRQQALADAESGQSEDPAAEIVDNAADDAAETPKRPDRRTG